MERRSLFKIVSCSGYTRLVLAAGFPRLLNTRIASLDQIAVRQQFGDHLLFNAKLPKTFDAVLPQCRRRHPG